MSNEFFMWFVVGMIIGNVIANLTLAIFYDEIMGFIDKQVNRLRKLFGLTYN